MAARAATLFLFGALLAWAQVVPARAESPSGVRRPVLALSPAQTFAWATGASGVGAPVFGAAPARVGGPPPAEFRRALARVRHALAPVCRKRCGSVLLVRDDAMPSAGQARPGAGHTTLAVNPNNMRGWKLAFGHEAPTLVLAHEYGHHLDMQNQLGGVASGDAWPQELLADVIAGCALARSGVPRRTLARAAQLVARTDFNTTQPHPHGADVSRSLRAGYTRCEARRPPTLEELLRETRDVWRVYRPGPLLSSARSQR